MVKIMKKNILLSAVFALALLFTACEPQLEDSPSIGNPPSESQLVYTITQDSNDPFTYIFENKSNVSGIVSWSIDGNGKTGNKVTHRFPLPGEYEVAFTLATRGGATTRISQLTTEETDWEFLESPLITALTGGADMINGKTWVIDASEPGHLGIGETSALTPNWWSATPYDKQARPIYDDEFTFRLVGFAYSINTNGSTHAQMDAANRGLAAGYYTSVIWEDAYDKDVTVNETARGNTTWSIVSEDGKDYIVLSNPNAYICYDDENPRKYQVLAWTENTLHLRTLGSGNARYHKLIKKGYVRPTITYNLVVEPGSEPNQYLIGAGDLSIPEGATITKIKADFGNGETSESSDPSNKLSVTYMRKSPYTVKFTVVSSVGDFEKTQTINVLNNHPDYEEFLIDAMVMYNDFSEVMVFPISAEDCSLTIVDNPLKQYPNRSSRVAHYIKENKEWANANMRLADGYRFDIRNRHTFKIMVYGKAGQVILLKLENTDMGGNAWQTGVELTYTIKKDNTWEVAEYNFAGVPTTDLSWDPGLHAALHASDVTTDPRYSNNYYNIIRIMCNPGNAAGVHEFYFDELAGPHVEGIKSSKLR